MNPVDPAALIIDRVASSEGLEDIAALQARSFAHPWGVEALRWELGNADVARLYAARTDDAALVAYCSCWILFDELHINSLAVADAWRRQGAARRLLAYVFRDAVTAGATKATLEVRQSNHAARALYEQLGFVVEAVRRDYYRDPREDALLLWHRDLASTAGRTPESERPT